MPHPHPIRSAFATVLRRPALIAAEIAWRWCFGISVIALLTFCGWLFFDSVAVSASHLAALGSGNPYWAAAAWADMFYDAAPKLIRIAAIVLPAATVLWIALASLGRMATLRMLSPRSRVRFASLVSIHTLRAFVTWVAVVAYVGAALLASFLSGGPVRGGDPSQQNLGIFLLVFLPILLVIIALWATLQWYCSLAPLLAARDGSTAARSLAASVRAVRACRSELTRVSLLFGVLRTAALAAVTIVSVLLAGLFGLHSWEPAFAAIALVSVAYFAVAGWLQITRLACYAAILDPQTAPQIASC